MVPRLGDSQEGKDERKLNCIHCWVGLRCLQAPEWKVLYLSPSSLVPILSADLPPCSSRKAIFRAVSFGFQAQWGGPAVVTTGGSPDVVTDSLETQNPQSSRSSFRHHRPLGDWIT